MAQNFLSDIKFGDNIYIRLGDSTDPNGDLQIYHDGSYSYIDAIGTGDFRIRSSGAIALLSDSNEDMVLAVPNGAVSLYHNNSKKFETTSAGITVTGNSTFTGNIITSGNILLNENRIIARNTSDGSDSGYIAVVGGGAESDGRGAIIRYYGNEHASEAGRLAISSGNVSGAYIDFRVAGNERMRIASDGTIKFNSYGAGYLKTDANGVISVDTDTIEDTLQSVTDRGSTTTNNITLDDNTTESPYVGYIDNSGANSSDIEYRTYSTNGNFLITRTGNGGADVILYGHATDHTSSTTTFAGNVTVGGDLIVSGDTVTLSTETIEVEDNIIVLNKTQSDGSATASTSGIAINRGGSTAQASFIFDDSDDYWDLTHNLAVAVNGKFGTVGATNNSSVKTFDGSIVTKVQSQTAGDTAGVLGTESNHVLKLVTNNTTALTFDTSQNATFAGIVDVDKNASSTSALRLKNGDTSNGVNNKVQIQFGFNGTTSYSHYITSRHNASGTDGNALDFYVGDTTQSGVYPTNATHNLTLENGRVGIGTTSPENLLHIKAADGVTGVLKIEGGKNTSTSVGEINSQIDFGSNDGSVWSTGNVGGRIASVTETTNGAFTGMAFYTFRQGVSSPDSLSEKVRITNDGKVGINLTNPTSTLTIKASDNAYTGGINIIDTDSSTKSGITHVNGSLFLSHDASTDDLVLSSGAATFAGNIKLALNSIIQTDGNSDNFLDFDDDSTTHNADTNVTTLGSISGIAMATNLNDGGGGDFTVSTGSTGTELFKIAVGGDATFSGNLYAPEYIYHKGNTTTYARFQTNRLTLHSGGGAVVDLHSNGQLYFTGDAVFYDTITLAGSSNEIIKSNGSIRLDIDNNNDQTDRVFIVSNHNAANELFKVDESGNGTFEGTVSSGAITSSGASSGRYTGLEIVNTTNAGGTETAIGLGVVSAANSACDVKLVANRVNANSGSDFYIEQTNSSGTQTETFRIAEDGNATFAGNVGIKESSIDANLHITDTNPNIKFERSGQGKWAFGMPNSQTYLAFDETSDDLSTPTMVLTKTTKRVGIGETSPYKKLEVAGDIQLDATDANIWIKSGAAGTNGFINWTFNTNDTVYNKVGIDYDTRATTGFHIDAGYPITIDATTNINFAISGSNKGVWNSTGLGVGTTSPSTKLYVDNGESTFNRGNSAGTIATFRGQNAAKAAIGTATSYFLSDVGIGTTSPDTLLTLEKSLADNTFIKLSNKNTSADISQQKSFIDFDFVDSNANFTPQVRIGAEVGRNGDANAISKESSGAFVVYTATGTDEAGAGSLTEKLRVDYLGNVGIGTTSPNNNANRSTLTLNHATSGGVLAFAVNDSRKALLYTENTTNNLIVQAESGESIKLNTSGANTALTLDNSQNANFEGDISIPVAKQLFFGGGSHTYISEDVDDRLRFFCGGDEHIRFTDGGNGDRTDFYRPSFFAQDVTISGDLIVTGNTTSVNVEDLNVEQGEITLNYAASSDTSSSADGAGIRIQDAVDASNDATMLWDTTSDRFEFSHGVRAPFFTSDGGRGFKQDSVAFVSTYSNGNDANAANDIGSSSNKWRDAYFSGQVNSATIQINSNGLLSTASTTSATTTTTIASLAVATYTAGFFDYSIKNGTNVRAGTVVATHDGTNVEFNETSTVDLGDTSDVTLSVDISSGDMRLRATTASSTWTIKALIRAI